jgi:hypothetical protein
MSSLDQPTVAADVGRFLQRYPDEVVGVLSGPDRVVYRGTFRGIGYVEGMAKFLSLQSVLLKNFGRFAASCTQRLKHGVERLAEAAGLWNRAGRSMCIAMPGPRNWSRSNGRGNVCFTPSTIGTSSLA